MLLLCEKNYHERVTQIWTSLSEEEEEAPLGVLFVMKTLKDEQWAVIMAYKLAIFEILRDFFVLTYIKRPRYPYIHIESTDSMMWSASYH